MATYNCVSYGNDKLVGCWIRYNCATNIIVADKTLNSQIALLTQQVWNNTYSANLATKRDVINAALL